MSGNDRDRSDQFHHAFNAIEQLLREELRADKGRPFADLVRDYCHEHKRFERHKPLLFTAAEVRNLNAHRFDQRTGPPAVPSSRLIQLLEQVAAKLRAIPTAGKTFGRRVVTIRPDDSLFAVMNVIASHDFSQLPVYAED